MTRLSFGLAMALLAGACGGAPEPGAPAPQTPIVDDPIGEPALTPKTPNAPSEGDAPDRCQIDRPAKAVTVRFGEVIPGMGVSLADIIPKGLRLNLDQVRFAEFTGQPGWDPDAIESVDCAVANVAIEAIETALATAVVRSQPDADCANEVHLEARITASSQDGAIMETMEGSLSLFFDSVGSPMPSRAYMFAEQPLSQMRGTARPSSLDDGSDDKPGAQPFVPTFRIQVGGQGESYTARLGFGVSAQGTLRYAEWRSECEVPGVGQPIP